MGYPYSNGDVLSHSDMNAVGLHLITPSSVTGGTLDGATVDISSAVSSVTVSGVFSADFENYRVIINSSASSNDEILFALESGASNWYGNRMELINTTTTVTVIASGAGGQTTAEIGRGGSARQSFISIDVYAPGLAFRKGITGNYYGSGYNGTFGYESPDGTARTGLVVSRSSGTFNSGTIRVYGYSDG